MTLLAALRRWGVGACLVAGLTLPAWAATPGRAPAAGSASERTGPPGSAQALASSATAQDLEVGRRIYREGVGAAGQPIVGLRFGGIEARGAAVACVNCHRPSGLGSVEGVNLVAPIAGRFIFSGDPNAVVSMNFRNVKNFNQRHEAFDDAGFLAAVHGGLHPSGRELSAIMPRFELSEGELRGLSAYLRTLSAQWSPGVDAQRLRLATVITPDVSPARRQIFLDTIKAAVSQKNGNYTPGQRTMSTAAEMLFNTNRFWDLEVWELQGDPQTWSAQLEARYRARPVFALVSGLGMGQWQPVHSFCEQQQVPCWFPSVDAVPASAGSDFYSLYFSSGVALEAEVLAQQLGGQRPSRVVQWHQGDAAGLAGAQALKAALAGVARGLPVATLKVDSADPVAVRKALAALRSKDALVLWWPATALAALGDVPPPQASVYLSARMAGAEQAPLSPRWKSVVQMVYPYQLPEQRAAGQLYFDAWLKGRQLALQDEALQSEVYFAMTYLAETLTDMLDNLHRDYLVERAESMLSLREGAKAEDQARELTVARHHKAPGPGGAQEAMARLNLAENRKLPRPMPGRSDHVMAQRDATTVYPHLSLGPGQRFASKGAYMVRFAAAQGQALQRTSDWLVP
jgi:hypothetical protein